jgi:PPOX class probable F420-dependent enzyme
MIDWSEKFARKVSRRLAKERVGWLVTVGSDNSPQPRPVWFLWDGETILLFSQAKARKIVHISKNPKVAFLLNTDEEGSHVVVLLGEAAIDPKSPPAHKVAGYFKKYRKGIAELEMKPEDFSRDYSVAIRVKPTSLRGW